MTCISAVLAVSFAYGFDRHSPSALTLQYVSMSLPQRGVTAIDTLYEPLASSVSVLSS